MWLSTLGLLNPLDAPHHVRQDEWSEYREGIVLDRPVKTGGGSYVNAGLRKVGYPNNGVFCIPVYRKFELINAYSQMSGSLYIFHLAKSQVHFWNLNSVL